MAEPVRRQGKRAGSPGRFDRDEWLARAMDVLAQKGGAKLTVDALCKALNVTKGSFYWHFEDRDDFVRDLVEYWSAQFTEPVIRLVSQSSGDAGARLKELLRVVSEGGYARYDVSIRAWAAQDSGLVADLVKAVDERRLAFVSGLFAAMGFDGVEAQMRAHATVAFLTFEAFVLAASTDEGRSMMLDRFYAMVARH